MKPFPSILDLLQSLLLCCILLGLGSLLFYSCTSNSNENTEETTTISPKNCFLEDKICKPNQRWLNTDSALLVNDFSIHPDSPKVLSFQIERSDVDTILQISKAADDSVLLRVYMSLIPLSSLDSMSNDEPTFRPILCLINTQQDPLQKATAFKMEYVDINIIAYLDSLVKGDIKIPAKQALKFISAWDMLPQDSIYNVMYENANSYSNDRVEFYTFDATDTRTIIDTLSADTTDILYLHLGVHYEKDSIPFRTILHIDNPKRFSPVSVDPRNPPLFEFAVPCPKLCGKD